MSSENKTVVVLSRDLATGLSVARSLGEAGYLVDFVANMKKEGRGSVVAGSKYVRKFMEAISVRARDGQDRGILDALVEYGVAIGEKRVLIASDDYTTFVVETNRAVLEEYFYIPRVEEGSPSILNLMNKSVQAALAKEAGLSIPMEWIIDLREEITVPGDMVYPCFCKPLDISSGVKKEMEMCNDEYELVEHLERLRSRDEDREIIVQEFLELDGEIQIAGVVNGEEVIAPAFAKTTDVAQYRDGVILSGKVCDIDELGEIKECVERLLKSLKYTGMFNIELVYAAGKYYFNDVNFRTSRLNHGFLKCGLNLPDLCVKTLLGEEIAEEDKALETVNKTFVFETVAWKDYRNNFITMEEFEECINSADFKVLEDEEDPAPSDIFYNKRIKTEKPANSKKKESKAVRRIKGALRPIKHNLLGYPQTKKENERDPKSEKPRVIICGRNYCSNLCMARAVGAAGYEVEILRIFQRKPRKKNLMKILKPDAYSKYVKAYHVCISRRSLVIVNRLRKLADKKRKMLLIPTDDLVTHIVDEYMEDLREYYVMPNVENRAGEINRLMSKGVQKKLAEEAGLPVLGSCVIKTFEGKFFIPESVKYPCFIKPNISKNGSKAKMRKCDSFEELRDALTELSEKKDIEMLVEDFVDIKKEYSILGVSTKDGAIGPGFFGAVEGGQNEQRGVALIGQVLPCDMLGDLHKQLVDFVGSLNYTGLYDIDLIETEDGEIYFVELNMRYGGSGYSIVASGMNLPGMFADYMLSKVPIDMDAKLEETGKTFLSEKIMIEEYIKGRITNKKLKESMNAVDIHFIMDENDPKPYDHFKKFFPVATVKRTMDSVKNK